ncbi:hypothetical protein ALC60_07036 [Trachymyrmex zeteki]|uniref:Uncharacterized protein n=1 Tax=Mycetomoellerius zeteki TaxID=64791 RepID=A0A151X128_9HYME|nr:hypothetical protein ALC60_07036 [Trachymyrmex zeteki]
MAAHILLTSLLFNLKPDKVTCDHKLMRLHLIKILQTNIIEHFSQDPQYAHPQKVLPIEVIRTREAEVLRIHMIRHQLTKPLDNRAVKMLQNITKEKDLENNRVKQMQRYRRVLKNNRAKQMQRYRRDLANNRAKQIQRYRRDLANNRAKQKQRCRRDLGNNHTKKRSHYEADLKNYRTKKRMRYLINFQHERNRQKSYLPRHYQCLQIRDMYKTLALLKKKSEVCLSLATKCETIDKKLCALCNQSRHTASSENYFIDSTYRNVSSSHLIMNVEGQSTNVLPLIEAQAKKSWLCDDNLCKIDPFLINCYEKVLQTISISTFKKIPELLQKIHKCTIKTYSNTKLGHTHSCYIDTTLCKAMSLSIYLLSPHFPKVGNIILNV